VTCRFVNADKPDQMGAPREGTFQGSLKGEILQGTCTRPGDKGPITWAFRLTDAAALRGRSGMKVDQAAQQLDANVVGFTGKCAAFVQKALVAGGVDADGHPSEAKNYGRYLIAKGFVELPKEDYEPKKGDIVVLQPSSTVPEHGHIAMYNGQSWVSDGKESRASLEKRLKGKGKYSLYRP
jgi:hypothetical protein